MSSSGCIEGEYHRNFSVQALVGTERDEDYKQVREVIVTQRNGATITLKSRREAVELISAVADIMALLENLDHTWY